MAAGLGFKDFTTGEVLTAADVDGYLMQGIWVFASAAARDSAVTSPQEGNFAYLKDTNITTYYTGSAWTNLDTTGMVNPMTTTGDTIYSSSGSTPARLGIGTAGQVLTVNSGATAPEWTTISSGGMTLISQTVASAISSLTLGSIPSTYKQLHLVWSGILHSGSGNSFQIRFNNSSSSVYAISMTGSNGIALNTVSDTYTALAPTYAPFGQESYSNDFRLAASGWLVIDNYASTTKVKSFYGSHNHYNEAAGNYRFSNAYTGTFNSTSAISSIDVFRASGSGTFSNIADSTIRLYGVS
jgi:hypothetical protein